MDDLLIILVEPKEETKMKKRTGRWRRLAALCLGIGLLAAGSLPAAAKSGEIRVQLKELGAENSSQGRGGSGALSGGEGRCVWKALL